MLEAAPLTMARKGSKASKCPSVDDWINDLSIFT